MKPKTTFILIAIILALVPAEIFIVLKVIDTALSEQTVLQERLTRLETKYLYRDAAIRALDPLNREVRWPPEGYQYTPDGREVVRVVPNKTSGKTWLIQGDGDWVAMAYPNTVSMPAQGSAEHKRYLREFLAEFPNYHTTIDLK